MKKRIIVIVVLIAIPAIVFASGDSETAQIVTTTIAKGLAAIGAGLCAFAAARGIGPIGAAVVESIARNPLSPDGKNNYEKSYQSKGILFAALIEGAAIIGLIFCVLVITDSDPMVPVIKGIAAMGAGICALGAAEGIGRIGKAVVESIARQPEMEKSYQSKGILFAALIEGAAIIGLIFCVLVITG